MKWIVLGIAAAVALWFLGIYNRFVRLRNLAQEAWSGVDVQLKRRWDLVPNLMESVKGYAAHEKQIFEDVAKLRSESHSATTPSAKAAVENALTQSLRSVFAVAEAYPELRATENFQDLQRNLAELEEQIQMARRYYNGSVRDYNILVDSFPSLLVARAFSYGKMDFFDLDEAERAVPKVAF